jgi:radical SAM protein with 4Fe4S-binding SPASM domain
MRGYHAIREADAQAGNPPRKILANTIIHRHNMAELPAFLDEQEALGFDGVQLLNLFRHGKGEPEDPGGLWFFERDLAGLDALVDELVRRVESQGRTGYRILNPVGDLRYIPPYYRDELAPLEAPCWSGWKELYINADGQAIMCDGQLEFLKGTFGNVRQQTLQQIWHSEELRKRRQVVKNCATPCMQNCYLRRSSDSARKILKGAASLALDEVRQQLRRRRSRSQGLDLPDGVLTLELSDTAPWFGEEHRTARRYFEDLVAGSPSPIDRCYADPFEYYEYRNRGYLKFDRGFMGFEVVRSVIEDLQAAQLRFGTLQLSWRGEPLMHPEFVPVLRYLLTQMERTHIFGALRIETDGRLLNTEIADVIAFHATVPQTWIVRGEGIDPFEDDVLRNLDYLLKVRKPAHRVVASWTVTESWDPHYFVETWEPRLSNPWKVAGRLPENGDGLWFRRTDHDHFQANADARNRLEEVAEILGLPCESGDESLPRRCPGAVATPVVSWDGNVTLCPWDKALYNKVGEVTSDRLSRIWTQETRVLDARREAKTKGVPGGELCRDCHYVYSPNYRQALPGELGG